MPIELAGEEEDDVSVGKVVKRSVIDEDEDKDEECHNHDL